MTEFSLTQRGIDPAIWEQRGCRRYQKGDTWVKEHFRPFLSSGRLGTVTRIVNQSAGWIMPKHSPPAFPLIPSQLRPDDAVTVDPRVRWHYHGPGTDERPTFPEAAGKAAGKRLPRQCMLYGASAEAHVNAQGDDQYDIDTGLGDHNGVPVDVVHPHAPRAAKYILLGEAKRIDLPPLAAERLPGAEVVHFVLEGGPKTDAVLSAGGCAFGVCSVTMWDQRELTIFAREHLHGKTIFVVPDSDWIVNSQVIRQALRVRTHLRRRGIDAYIAAPPHVDGRKVGVDDFLGAGNELDEMEIAGWEPPWGRIREATSAVPYQRRRKATEVLENLSLYVGKDGTLTVGFATLKRLLAIRDWYRVLPTLETIDHCFTVESGSLEAETREYKEYRVTEWKHDTPTIRLNDYYRAQETRQRLLVRDFWKETAIDLLRNEVDDLKRRQHDLEARFAA